MDTINWTLPHYKALLLLHASHADLDYSDAERDHIIGLVGPQISKEVELVFKEQSDFEILDFLVSRRNDFMPGQEGRTAALQLVNDLFKIDGDYSKLERSSYKFLEKMFYQDGDRDIEIYNG